MGGKNKLRFRCAWETRQRKIYGELISLIESLIKEFSTRFFQFKELSETFKFIMYPDVISFDKTKLIPIGMVGNWRIWNVADWFLV